MSLIRVKEYLKGYGLDKEIMEFKESSATVKDAASVIGCSEGQIAKSLSFLVNDKPIIIVVSGDKKIDNSKFKKEFCTKARMIPYDLVEKYTGHMAGGVCPFGVNSDVTIYLDESLKKFSYVYPACGSSNSAIKIEIKTLEDISGYKKWVDVCKSI